jgi:hypothetical protein
LRYNYLFLYFLFSVKHHISPLSIWEIIIRQIKSRRMRWVGHMACMGEGRNMYRVLVGKPEGKGPLERPRHRWEDGLKMDLKEIGWWVWSGFTWLRIGIVDGLL